MAACTNNGGSRARRAVTAALVGVLSVGTVPMVALAEGVADTISPLFAEGGIDGTQFSEGDILAVFTKVSNGSNFVPVNDIDGVPTITAAENLPFTVTATHVRPAGSATSVEVTPGNDYKVALYRAGEDGEPTGSALSGNRVFESGEYVLTVTPLTGSAYVGETFCYNFQVVGTQIEANKPYEHGNPADHDLQFTGSALDLTFAMNDGTELVEGTDYTVKYNKGGKSYDEVVDAGTYTATLTGLGAYAGTTATSAPFTVRPYHLEGSSTVIVDPFENAAQAPTHPSRVYWTDGDTDKTDDVELNPELVVLTPTTAIDDSGVYAFDVSADPEAVAAGNIEFDAAVDAFRVSAVKADGIASFSYNGAALEDTYDILPGQSFNVNAVAASYGGTQLGTVADGSIKVIDGYNNTTVPGEYKVTFEYTAGTPVTGVNATLDGKYVAGTKTVTVRVWAGAIDADTQLWVFGPNSSTVAINSFEKGYDGEVLDADSFYVTNQDRTIYSSGAGAQLTAKLYDADGNEVDYAINAGTYTLKVTSDDYMLSGTTEMTVTIGKVDLESAEIGEIVRWNDVAGQEYLPIRYVYVDGPDADTDPDHYEVLSYVCSTNGSAITNLGIVYATGNDGAKYDEVGWVFNDFKGQDLLPDNVDVTVEVNDEGTWKPVAKIDEAGQYRVILTVGEDVASNYTATSKTIEFTVAEKGSFSDVQPSDWCYEAVELANRLGYMTGYGTSGMFGPNDIINRGQAVSVLYKMSGANAYSNPDSMGMYVEGKGWFTGFDDVDPEMYYAEAIAWAKATGVVNGYTEDTFGPEDEITREQFAGMLSNYAKIVNRDETVGTADVDTVLGEFPDGSQVSDWAAEAVAWAASATDDRDPVMGNNGSLMPSNSISRAEVAAMVTNYQPVAK